MMISLSGYASGMEITLAPLHDVVTVPKSIQRIPLGLIEISTIPQEIPKGSKLHLISFPDEVVIERTDSLEFRPSAGIVPATDVLLLGLRHAGLTVESYPTLTAAKKAGALLAIVGVMTGAEVRISEEKLETHSELAVVFADLGTFEILGDGRIKALDSHGKSGSLPEDFFTEAEAASPKGEIMIQSIRTLMTQSYYHLSMDLASRLQEVLSIRKP
jgi:hypothetical protein